MTLSVAMVTRKLAILLAGAAAKSANNINNNVTRKNCIAMVTVFFQSQIIAFQPCQYTLYSVVF